MDALEKTAYFTLGCKSLTVGTEHQPPIPIINATDMEKVMTPKLIRLKGKLLRWGLRVVYIPGKFLGGGRPVQVWSECATTMTRQ